MPESDRLDRRLRAVERTLTGDDHDLDALAQTGDFARRLDDVEARLDDLEDRVDDLDAAAQAVRGYVGNVRSVNEKVAQRADAALAAVDRLEDRLDESGQHQCGPGENTTDRRGERLDASRHGQPASDRNRTTCADEPSRGGTSAQAPRSAPRAADDQLASVAPAASEGAGEGIAADRTSDENIDGETVLDRLRARL